MKKPKKKFLTAKAALKLANASEINLFNENLQNVFDNITNSAYEGKKWAWIPFMDKETRLTIFSRLRKMGYKTNMATKKPDIGKFFVTFGEE